MSWRDRFSELLAEAAGKADGWSFTYYDGETDVTLPVAGILAKLKAFADKLAVISRLGGGCRDGYRPAPEDLFDNWREIFPAKWKWAPEPKSVSR